jgi:hypothetical protein
MTAMPRLVRAHDLLGVQDLALPNPFSRASYRAHDLLDQVRDNGSWVEAGTQTD